MTVSQSGGDGTPETPKADKPQIGFSLSGAQILGAMGVVLAFIGLLIWLLYSSITEQLKEVKDDVKATTAVVNSFDQKVLGAETSATRVTDLLARAPTLESDIKSTHDTVLIMDGELKLLASQVNPIPGQLTRLQASIDDLKNQTNSMQNTISRIPGLPK